MTAADGDAGDQLDDLRRESAAFVGSAAAVHLTKAEASTPGLASARVASISTRARGPPSAAEHLAVVLLSGPLAAVPLAPTTARRTAYGL